MPRHTMITTVTYSEQLIYDNGRFTFTSVEERVTFESFEIEVGPILIVEGPFDAVALDFLEADMMTFPIKLTDDIPDALSPDLFELKAGKIRDRVNADQPDPDQLLIDHLLGRISDLKSEVDDAKLKFGDALEEIDDLNVKLSRSEARAQLNSDRLSVEIERRRHLESRVNELSREVDRERLARVAVIDKLIGRNNDFMRMADRYNSMKLDGARLANKVKALEAKLLSRLDDGDNSILIRELLADLAAVNGN